MGTTSTGVSFARLILSRLTRTARLPLSRSIDFSEWIGLRLKSSPIASHQLGRTAIDTILLPSDVRKIINSHTAVFGRPPNLIRPATFNEKLQRQKLIGRKHSHTILADKLRVRDYIARTIGPEYLARLIWDGDRLSELPATDFLPEKFIIKTNHSSGTNIICRSKSDFDWEFARRQTDAWLKQDLSALFAEWQYRWIKPKVLIEELLSDESGGIPADYRMFCFDGKVRLIQVDYDSATNHTRLMFDREYEPLDVSCDYPRRQDIPPPPKNLKPMRDLAETISRDEKFVRVDFYDLGDRIVFGEMTFHPAAGRGKFAPYSFDYDLGRVWT